MTSTLKLVRNPVPEILSRSAIEIKGYQQVYFLGNVDEAFHKVSNSYGSEVSKCPLFRQDKILELWEYLQI